MVPKNNTEKYHNLRKQFPCFVYENFTIDHSPEALTFGFTFRAGSDYAFHPTVRFPAHKIQQGIPTKAIEALAFHIGLVEMISYWKAFCSPEILIKSGRLNSAQEEWWKKLFLHGLGEFFYTNGINVQAKELFSFSYTQTAQSFEKIKPERLSLGAIIPVGGGKDSVVTLDLLKRAGIPILPMVVNHRAATRQVLMAGGFNKKNSLEVSRSLDPLLLELNEKGFLNGHTPFSALLAFVTVTAAYLMGYGQVVLSNESSANEATIPGTRINHQYSKSFEFEQDFRDYLQTHLISGINYFSFLRPLNELQIGALFSKMHEYHKVFKSCNAGSKTDSWCCNCSKCLFTWIILSPFIKEGRLEEIFGKNLLKDPGLIPVLDQLAGFADTKPFECVGTIDEVKAALGIAINDHEGKELPLLLAHFRDQNPVKSNIIEKEFGALLLTFHQPHFLDEHFVEILRKAIPAQR